jgi:hypothetical protein
VNTIKSFLFVIFNVRERGIGGTAGTVGCAERLWGNMNLINRKQGYVINKEQDERQAKINRNCWLYIGHSKTLDKP